MMQLGQKKRMNARADAAENSVCSIVILKIKKFLQTSDFYSRGTRPCDVFILQKAGLSSLHSDFKILFFKNLMSNNPQLPWPESSSVHVAHCCYINRICKNPVRIQHYLSGKSVRNERRLDLHVMAWLGLLRSHQHTHAVPPRQIFSATLHFPQKT